MVAQALNLSTQELQAEFKASQGYTESLSQILCRLNSDPLQILPAHALWVAYSPG